VADGLRFADVDCSIDTPFSKVRNNAAIEKFWWRTVKELAGEPAWKFEFASALRNANGEPQWLAVLGDGLLNQDVTFAAHGMA
jgi:hypothetical protein